MWVTAFFTEQGTPKTGLTPKVSIWKVSDDSVIVNEQNMSEIGGGFYKFEFSAYDPDLDYAVRCDGGSGLPVNERYSYGGNEGFHDDIAEIQDTLSGIETLIRRILGMSQENYRLFNTTYDVSGQRLAGCTIKLYNNKTDCDNDQNEFATYAMSATYGQNGQLSDYKVTRTV